MTLRRPKVYGGLDLTPMFFLLRINGKHNYSNMGYLSSKNNLIVFKMVLKLVFTSIDYLNMIFEMC